MKKYKSETLNLIYESHDFLFKRGNQKGRDLALPAARSLQCKIKKKKKVPRRKREENREAYSLIYDFNTHICKQTVSLSLAASTTLADFKHLDLSC